MLHAFLCLQEKLSKILPLPILESVEYRSVMKDTETSQNYEATITRNALEQSWSKNFPTVNPLKVLVTGKSRRFTWNAKKSQRTKGIGFRKNIAELEKKGYIVPFLGALKQFLSIRVVFEAVVKSFESYSKETNGHYSDVSDGSYVRSNPVFVERRGEVLLFQIYGDDVELSNPLGSKKGKHKV